MYRLLLLTDQKSVLQLYESFEDWTSLGFSPPTLLSEVEKAMEMVRAGEVDAISYALPKESGQAFFSFMARYPQIRNMEAASDPIRLRRAVNGLRRQLREREQEADLHGDVLELLQNEFFHSLMAGDRSSRETLVERMKALGVLVDLQSPVVVAQMRMPEGQTYISQVWRYGRERLKVALHNFYEQETPAVRFVLDVLSLSEIKLMLCPKKPFSEQEALDLFYDHLTRTREEVRRYLDLGMEVVSVTLYANLEALAAGAPGRETYRVEEA